MLSTHSSLRLLHHEDARLRCDRFGRVCWAYWYEEAEPSAQLRQQLDALCVAVDAEYWHLHGMSDRGRDPQHRRHWNSPGAPNCWQADESGMRYALHADRGQSAGLFLDQRANRLWVREHARGRSVANLFAYTGGFGIAAALGGAHEVVQVDVSRPYLAWAHENASLNGVDGEIEEAVVDADLFLRGCRKRGRRFDAIICDPPSFARAQRRGNRNFRVTTDLGAMAHRAVDLLNPGGWVLVSSNAESWSRAQMVDALRQALPEINIKPAPGPGADYEEGRAEPLLKSFVLRV